ncbi:hypothetical protein [Tenacibaculum holothuriorum]|uniref:hypothetical protein n=1 Tax=Tenacibaculum holothuriorum TaxID=1635173 RepID=UPI00130296CC|nr:hypothetical protein [Tenacibaculum holothuriorum]
MSKSLEYLIIGLGLASVLFALYGVVIREGEFLDALSGIVIGASLVGTVIINRNQKKEE